MTSSAIMTSSSTSLGSPPAASTSQYLHPDYIQMMPSSLDAKNSPLALLAQTCSSIGKDPTPPLAPCSSSSHKLASTSSKDSSSSSSHHHHHNHHHGKDDKPRPKSESPHSDHRSLVVKSTGKDRLKEFSGRSGGGASAASGKGLSPTKPGSRASAMKDLSGTERLSPVDGGLSLSSRSLVRDGLSGKPTAAAAVVSSSICGSLVSSTAAGPGGAKTIPTSPSISMFDLAGTDSVQRYAALHQQLMAVAAAAGRGSLYGPVPPLFPLDHHAFAGGATPTTGGLYPAALAGAGFPSLLGPQIDPVQLQQLYAAAAATQSPSLYADYAARLKAATVSTLSCKDPYCARCPLGAPGCAGAVGSSTAGDKLSAPGTGASLLQSAAAGSSMIPPALSFLPAASLHALLLQQMSAATAPTSAGGGLPGDPLSATSTLSNAGTYTCSWVDGASDFCGLRFCSSDELLQHLRVHASAADPSGASLAPPHPAALAALSASFPLGLRSSVPRLSPTPLADVQPPTTGGAFGPMSHGFSPSSSRYHPYKTPPAVPAAGAFSSPGGVASLATGLPGSAAGSAGAAPLFPPALAAFYSPYAALYGHRLGAAAVGP